MNTIRAIFVRTAYVVVILAVVLSVGRVVAHAAPTSPFLGRWQTIDPGDGSDIRLVIAGPANGPFQITWTESYFGGCGGEAGIVRGTGQLSNDNPNILEAHLTFECFRSGQSNEFDVAWHYHPTSNTLSTRDENGFVTIWHRPGKAQAVPPALNLRVNYGHDWVESFYEGGHTVWISVTESDGVTLKATAELFTAPREEWGGESGFQTRPEDWSPAPVDIQPYDRVYGWVDNGASAAVQIGDIGGSIDLAADSIVGTINASWFSDEVEVECHSWGAPLPEEILKYDMTFPDGSDTYSCSWAGEWDIQPGQDVGVAYTGPDGQWVANVFQVPDRNPRIVASEVGNWLWTTEFNSGTLDLFIYESSDEGANLLWSGQRYADDGGFVLVDDHGLDLVPGNYLVVSDGVNQKGLVLQPISVTVFDIEHDFMAGAAPQGSEVWVAAGPQEWQQGITVEADPITGEWLADFAAIGFDITEEMQPWSYAQIHDEDGDTNEGGVPPLQYWVASFISDFGTWAEGEHSYYFEYGSTFPEPDEGGTTETTLFTVSSEAFLYDGFVLLWPSGRGVQIGGVCIFGGPSSTHPDQATRFVFGWGTAYPMTYDAALAHFDSTTVTAHLDGAGAVELVRHEILGWDNWSQYVCTLTQ